MTAQDFLSQAFLFSLEIKSKEEQILQLRELSLSAGAVAYGEERVQTARRNDKIGDVIVRIQELIDSYARDVTRLLYLKHQISEAINGVSDAFSRIILEKRYINFDNWEKIAEDTNYTERHIYNLHKKALKEIIIPKPEQK